MKSDQLFQVDRQINQIRKVLEQRHEKMSEFNPSLFHVLSPNRSPDEYLSKKYPNSHLRHFQRHTQGKIDDAQKMLQTHLTQSRVKIRAHHNQLKELDELVKKRNIIRLIKMKEGKGKENVITLNFAEKTVPVLKKDVSRTLHDVEKQKEEREHTLLNGLKGEKILEVIQDGKSRGASGEEVAHLIKRQLGMGIQNTPFYSWMERKRRQQKVMLKTKSVNKLNRFQKPKTQNFSKTMEAQIRPRKHIYLNDHKHLSQNFQNRLINILRYHNKNIQIS